MTITAKTRNWTAADSFNIPSSKALNSATGELVVHKLALGEDVSSETGEFVKAVWMSTDDGIYSSISATVYNQAEQLLEMNTFPVTIAVKHNKSRKNSNREFLSLELVG